MRNWKKRKPDAGPAGSGTAGEDARPKTSALDRALGFLSRREHSARELSRKLADRGHGREEAAEAVAAVRDHSYQSDARFADSVIRRRAAAGYGPRYIEAELKSHGIDPRHHRESFDAQDWVAHASDAVAKRGLSGRRGLEDRDGRTKAVQFLARRGFDSPTIKRALDIASAPDLDD